MNPSRLLACFWLAFTSLLLHSQETTRFSFRQSFSIFAEYSNNSSHIALGVAENRRLAGLGLTYSRRLVHSRYIDWNYAPELLPLVFIQNPIANTSFTVSNATFIGSSPTVSACHPETIVVPPNPSTGFAGYSLTRACDSRWTYSGGLSPLGQRINIAPTHRIQPFLLGNGGFLVSSRDVPVNDSSSFNFTFEFGAGVEFFRDAGRSWSAEYRLHHLSNAYIGVNNPGIDSQIFKLTYTFAR